MESLDRLFDQFCKERHYLAGTSQLTLKSYRQALERYRKAVGETLPDKASLTAFVIDMRQTLSPVTCNISIRGFNVFLSWLAENGHITEPLRCKQIKEPKKAPQGLTDSELSRLMNWKPKTFGDFRLHALLCLLIDTGLRIDEAVHLETADIDFDNLLLKVQHGKGDKERIVPISLELRKILYRLTKKHTFPYLFTTRSGNNLQYHNARREFHTLCNKLGIKPCGFHNLRRSFALNFIRQGGNLFILQRLLGHTSIQVTQRYVNLETQDLKDAHVKTSMLKKMLLKK